MDGYSSDNQIKMVIVAIKKLDEPCGCRNESKDCQLLLAKLMVEVTWAMSYKFHYILWITKNERDFYFLWLCLLNIA